MKYMTPCSKSVKKSKIGCQRPWLYNSRTGLLIVSPLMVEGDCEGVYFRIS